VPAGLGRHDCPPMPAPSAAFAATAQPATQQQRWRRGPTAAAWLLAWLPLLGLGLGLGPRTAAAGEVEVLHFWTSPGEAASLAQLKSLIARRGHTWKDFAVVGGAGQNAMLALKERVASGRPPASATIKGPALQEWAAQGALANLDWMAAYGRWDESIPPAVQAHVKHKGRYVAVPVNIHRVNWMWSNLAVLRAAGVPEVPSTFEAFLDAAGKVRAAGFVPVAHGGQPWQEFVLFESVAIGVGGLDFYRKAFVELDPTALTGARMVQSLSAFRRLKGLTDAKAPGRDWDAATDMVIKGRAAFQFMGDWAKGEFLSAGNRPGREFACTPAPGTAGSFSFVIDTFAMFELASREAQQAQGYMAYVLLGDEFQEQFNVRKGSIPVRADVPLDRFDDCARGSRRDFQTAARSASLLPSVAVDMALPPPLQAALREVVSAFWNADAMPIEEAIDRLAQVAAARKPARPRPNGAR
jgi:glucose/mannose transport system substrate-binding protein